MNAPERSSDARRLEAIRRRVALVGEDAVWQVAFAGTARLIVDEDGTELLHVTERATSADQELAAGAPEDLRFLLGLLERATTRIFELQDALTAWRNANPLPGETAGENKNYAAEAAIKVQGPRGLEFRQFLRWHPDAQPVGGASGDRDPEETASDRLRAILGISSRKQLNTEPGAAARWVALKAEYEEFRKMPETVRAAEYPGYGAVMREGGE